jgi:formamidopyrimidine-DNA glycosylase
MPEGHTIHRLAREHTQALAGHVLHVWSPQGRHTALAAALDQHLLEHVDAHGKHLFYRWRAAPILHIHLGLFGSFRESASGSSPPRPSAQLRLEGPRITLDLVGATTCELVDSVRRDQILGRLGPDLLASDADADRAWERLRRRSTPIGAALLDQQLMSGVGNVYRLEALFVNGIHPERPATTLSRAEFDALWDTLRTMLRQGVEERRIVTVHPSERAAAADANGVESVPPEDAFYVYQQQRCRRCRGPIRAWRLGARPAYACERCQPPPARSASD